MASERERRAWIAVASVTGIGLELMPQLTARYGNATNIIERAVAGDVRAWAREYRRANRRPLMSNATLTELEQLPATMAGLLDHVERVGLWTRTLLDADYPERLKELDPPPPVIHGLGDPSLLDAARSVAVVGTRRPTPAGRVLAGRVAARLVELGAVVVSGVAVGIDGAAHAATLASGCRTVGVIGGGHEHPGPRAHDHLRRRIVTSGGALISEHHPKVEPTQGTYPRRNRVIAALTEATIVVEAPLKSGALITARIAMELGRLALVAPGRIGEWSTAGSLGLLRDGPARLLTGLDEMIVDLGYDHSPSTGAPATAGSGALSSRAALALLVGPELSIAERLRRAPAGLDALVDDTGLAPSVVSSAVTLLLLRGWIQAVGPAFLPAGPLLVA
jgi:DNA processing protein